MTEPKTHLIWSNDHAAWWGPNRCGYTSDRSLAGRYTKAEAERIAAADRKRAWSTLPDTTPAEMAVPLEPEPSAVSASPSGGD